MHLVGEISVKYLSGWESVRRAFVWSGKCPSGMFLVGEVPGHLLDSLYKSGHVLVTAATNRKLSKPFKNFPDNIGQ